MKFAFVLLTFAFAAVANGEVTYFETFSTGTMQNKPVTFKSYTQVTADYQKNKARVQRLGVVFNQTSNKFERRFDELDTMENGKWTNHYVDQGKWKAATPEVKVENNDMVYYKVSRPQSDGATIDSISKKVGKEYSVETIIRRGNQVVVKLTGKSVPSTKAAFDEALKKAK